MNPRISNKRNAEQAEMIEATVDLAPYNKRQRKAEEPAITPDVSTLNTSDPLYLISDKAKFLMSQAENSYLRNALEQLEKENLELREKSRVDGLEMRAKNIEIVHNREELGRLNLRINMLENENKKLRSQQNPQLTARATGTSISFFYASNGASSIIPPITAAPTSQDVMPTPVAITPLANTPQEPINNDEHALSKESSPNPIEAFDSNYTAFANFLEDNDTDFIFDLTPF